MEDCAAPEEASAADSAPDDCSQDDCSAGALAYFLGAPVLARADSRVQQAADARREHSVLAGYSAAQEPADSVAPVAELQDVQLADFPDVAQAYSARVFPRSESPVLPEALPSQPDERLPVDAKLPLHFSPAAAPDAQPTPLAAWQTAPAAEVESSSQRPAAPRSPRAGQPRGQPSPRVLPTHSHALELLQLARSLKPKRSSARSP
jgi:hypothetical protein